MSLPDRLHCPGCQGRLAYTAAGQLCCCRCEQLVSVADGIADLASGLPAEADRYLGLTQEHGLLAAGLPKRIRLAAAERWPASLGDVIEFGCGVGTMTEAILRQEVVRSLLVLDSDPVMLRACQKRVSALDGGGRWVSFAALAGGGQAIRDAVADTIVGGRVLAGIGDTRGFLAMVHRVLKPGGRAMFVVPNRRYRQAVCCAMAEALTQHFARHGAWPDDCDATLKLLAESRRRLVHRADRALLDGLEDKQLFDSEALQDMAEQIGFATADMIPLDADPAGAQSISRLCQDAGAPEGFAQAFGPLAAAVGRPFLSLLGERDSSVFNLLWLTKAAGPAVRVYSSRPAEPRIVYPGADAALGGVQPRWSVELLARDTAEGVEVTIGGWCLSNIDVLEVRITLDGSARGTPVWRHRPDVHAVVNRDGLFHSFNALCSGVGEVLLFHGVHPAEPGCALRMDIVLAGGLMVTGPAPEMLVMDQPVVIAH